MKLANAAKWAKDRGISKLNFILFCGLIIGIFATILSKTIIFLFDSYLLHREVNPFDFFQIIGILAGSSAAGIYSAAKLWERLEKVENIG